jgi:hypothetical protein
VDQDAVENFGGEAAAFIADDRSVSGSVDRTVFAGSNKNNDAISTWNWATGNAPVKDDLANVYAYAVKNDVGDLVLYFGGERLSPNGDSHIDLEFNQEEIKLDKATPCGSDQSAGPSDGSPCEFIGNKSEGDLIISLDYTKGGDLGSFEVRKFSNGNYVEVVTLPGPGCNDTFNGTAADAICGFTNGETIDGGGWPSYDSHNAVITQLPKNSFAEFGINVTEALDETPCFASFGAHTRTSQSFTSELKDFAVGSFQVCQPNTALTAGASVTFTFTRRTRGRPRSPSRATSTSSTRARQRTRPLAIRSDRSSTPMTPMTGTSVISARRTGPKSGTACWIPARRGSTSARRRSATRSPPRSRP